jgi:AcrR family transcriptional regulator
MEDDESDTGLPASIAASWGRQARPRKGPKPGLKLERIVEAAVRVAASDGLAAVSMKRVATELGASPMALYRYVATKDELLTLMVDAAGGVPPAAAPDEDWRAGLTRWAEAYRALLRRHLWILRIPISGPPVTPNQVGWLEDGLLSLRETGLSEQEKLSAILLLSGYVRNEATLMADIAAAAATAGTLTQQMMPGYGRLLAKLIDAERFPALDHAVASGAFDDDDDPDAEFVFGLERVLDGIDALVRARAPAA